jgi:hypothetical protein
LTSPDCRAPTRRALRAASIWLGLASWARAQAFPSKAITIVAMPPAEVDKWAAVIRMANVVVD